MIIAIDGPPALGVIHSFPTFFATLLSCHHGPYGCVLAPANVSIFLALVFGVVAGAICGLRGGAIVVQLANWGLLTSIVAWSASLAVIVAFYWTADPINTESEYPSLGPYFDVANWIFGISLLALSTFLGFRLGCPIGRALGSGGAP